MAYATQAEVEKLVPPPILVQLADDNHDGVADTNVLTEALEWADDQINAYCGARYQVPFASVPGVINKAAVDLAVYYLYSRRATSDVPPIRKQRYDAVMKFLRDAADGKVSLGVQPAPAEDAGSHDGVARTRETDDRVFTIKKSSTNESGSLDRF